MQIGVITNPNSRKNRNRPGRAQSLQNIVGSLGEVRQTETLESIKPVLRDFLRKRARYWVADGGDGALHWMVRMGLEVLQEDEFTGGGYSLPMTMPTNGGTIDFVAHNVGIKGNAEGLLATMRRRIESGARIEQTAVDSMAIDGVQVIDGVDVPFRTYGFAVAAGGVGQRFFGKYYEAADPNAKTIVSVVRKTLLSLPMVAMGNSRFAAVAGMGQYARDMFAPTRATVEIDGVRLPGDTFTGIHVASMSIDLGGVLKFFGKADEQGVMNALVGTPSPLTIVRNLPRMARGGEMRGNGIVDRPCRSLTITATGDELLAPIVDGERYKDLRSMTFSIGPRVQIPKVVATAAN